MTDEPLRDPESEVPDDHECPECYGLLNPTPKPNRWACLNCGRAFDGNPEEDDGLVQVKLHRGEEPDVDSDDVRVELERIHYEPEGNEESDDDET